MSWRLSVMLSCYSKIVYSYLIDISCCNFFLIIKNHEKSQNMINFVFHTLELSTLRGILVLKRLKKKIGPPGFARQRSAQFPRASPQTGQPKTLFGNATLSQFVPGNGHSFLVAMFYLINKKKIPQPLEKGFLSTLDAYCKHMVYKLYHFWYS